MDIRLDPDKSRCKASQKIIVSQDNKSSRKHIAYNDDGFRVRHYRLDGDLVKQEKCCDFLLLNDSNYRAYFVELKGRNIEDAVPQLENAERLCRSQLKGYTFLYRIVCSKAKTHDIQKTVFRKFKDKCGTRLQYKCNVLEEKL